MRENACWVLGTVQIILIIRTLICSTEKVYGSSPYSPIHSTKWYYLYIYPLIVRPYDLALKSLSDHINLMSSSRSMDGWERWTRAGILVFWIEIDPIPDDQTYKLFLFFFIASSSKNSRVLSNIICSKQSIEQSKHRSDMWLLAPSKRNALGLNEISVQSKIPDVSIPLLNIGEKILIN